MRTREEQIEDLANDLASVVCSDAEGSALAEQYILEAERRAEQRVRAEIARDSERLDWLSDGQHELVVDDSIGVVVTDDRGETHIHEDIRQAIDAAREVG